MGRVFFDQRKNVVDITVATQVLPSDSGNLFVINQASGAYSITLPLMADIERGWNCSFVIGTVATNAVAIINTDGEDTIVGGVAGADGGAATHAETAVDSITFISGAVLGDTCTIVSNGVNYFVTGYAADVAHVTVS